LTFGIDILNRFKDVLPNKPYCTNELGILFIRARESAIKHRYVQQNSPFDLYWLVYDVDRPTSHFDWDEIPCTPPPNITVMNPDNGHSHLFYGLEVPVLKCIDNPKVHAKPLRYAAAIDIALALKLDADPGYTGLICKNPLHNHWTVHVWQTHLYDLNWLADYLDLGPYKDGRRRLPPIGLGRNCTLFDLSRRWSYVQIRKTGVYAHENYFVDAVTDYAAKKNNDFPVPLPSSEIRSIGRSVGRWTWRNMSPEGFIEWGERRREHSIVVRQAKSAKRAEEIRAYKLEHPEMSNRKIALIFGVDERTVRRALQG
jgi:hypothetical protein